MRYCVVMVLLLCAFSLRAQKEGQPLIDSLVSVLPGKQADTGKVRLYVMISRLYNTVEPKKGFAFAGSGMVLAQRLQWRRGMADLDNSMGLLTGDTGNNAGARGWFEKSLAINKTLDAGAQMIANMNNIGRSYERESDLTRASEYYFQAMALAESTGNDEQAALVGTNITALYILQKDYTKAAAYAAGTIKKGESAGAPVHVAKAYELLGVLDLETGDTPLARKSFDTALAIDQRLGNSMAMLAVLSNMGTAEPDPKKAIEIFLREQEILEKVAPSSENGIVNLINLGLNYSALGATKAGEERRRDFVLAGDYLDRADKLCRSTNNPRYEIDIQDGMASLAEARGDYKAALEHYRRYTSINDSIFSQDNKNKIAGLESRRSIELKNKEIENKGLQIANQRRTVWLLVVCTVLFGAMGVVLLRLNNKLSEANKVKAKFFGILSHDLRSPIAGVLNFLQLQQKKPDSMNSAEKAGHWEKMGHSAAVLLDTMEAMLLWSKGQMKYFKPGIGAVEVGELFGRLQRLFGDTEGVVFRFQCEEGLVVRTDEDYLWTIMQNLTANAVRALGQTEDARIDWKAWRAEKKVCFSIADNGPGISSEQLRALYDETASMGARQGLGLHIIRDLAKAIGCVVTLRTRPGAGAGDAGADAGAGRGAEFVLSIDQ
jgi:signal transduction histidine kinase/Tfp pilus assembly protein PilF